MDYTNEITSYFCSLRKTIEAMPISDINEVINILEDARETGKNVFVMGNGGSAATSSHFVCDFNKGLSDASKKRYKFICLNDNIPSLMAYANDISYEAIFVEQLKNYFNVGDIVIGISGSGNSKNVLNAIEYANNNAGVTIGITGFNGGQLKKLAKCNINIPINDMQITEDLHLSLDHCIMKILSSYE